MLVATYQEAVCGDGKVLGPEACDDENTTGDGCSADCLAVEWPEVCAGLPLLPAGPFEATTVGGPPIYALDGICALTSRKTAGRSASWRRATEKLQVAVDEKGGNLVVYVQDGCGPVTGNDYLACANSSFDGGTETATATLAKDQLVTVIVSGFSSPGGAFTLSSTFTPAP